MCYKTQETANRVLICFLVKDFIYKCGLEYHFEESLSWGKIGRSFENQEINRKKDKSLPQDVMKIQNQ